MSAAITPPPPTPPPAASGGRAKLNRTQRLSLIVLAALIAVGMDIAFVMDEEPTCDPASTAALDTIESGAKTSLTLTDGVSRPSTITFATGDQQAGVLVAADTPTGVGVWIMDEDANGGAGTGLVYAVNDEARAHTDWGEATNFEPADAGEVADIEECL
jgi:hypothetical protein